MLAKKFLKGFVITYVLLFGILSYSYAQQARIAIVGGLNESTVIQTSNQPNFNNYKRGYSPRIGFHIGLMADFPLSPKSKFYFQPAIEFFNKGRKFAQTAKNGVGDTAVYQTNNTQFLNYIDIPLNIVYKFELAKNLAFIVGLGPYISFFYNGKESSTTVGPNNYYAASGSNNLPVGNGAGQYRTLDYGMNALAGLYLGGSFITANFSRGLQNAYQDSTYSGTFKNQVFSITLGVYLGERKKKKPENKIDSTDTDNDGIIDKVDFCPTVSGLKKYNGCPIPDSDCDSINDEEDKCPDVAGLRRYNGCPIPDTDSDGVNDEEDRCLTTKGLPQYKGCPVPIDETLVADSISGDTMIYYIYYDPNKTTINIKGAVTITKIHKLLQENKDLNVKISGYSDRSNDKKITLKQSASRAIIVRNHLKNGILPSRTKVYYWGSSKANASRKDTTGQWKDRRVEIAVYQKAKPVTQNHEVINKAEKEAVDVTATNIPGVVNSNAEMKKHNENVDSTVVDNTNAAAYKNNQQIGVDNNPADSDNNKKNNQVVYNNNQIKNNPLVKDNNYINNNPTDTTTEAVNQIDSGNKNRNNNKNDERNSAVINNNLTDTSLAVNRKADKGRINSSVNNPVDSNNSTGGINTINSKKNTVVPKSKSPIPGNNLVSRSARNSNANTNITIDTTGIDQTLTKKGPSQINDTDKVLDCYTIYFDPNESILNSASFDILDHIRGMLKTDSTLYIGIYGYSERVGSESSAQRLSKERAFLTRDYMNSYGVTIDRMRVSYWGSKMPVADNNDPYQQWENRRVEICIYIYPQ